MLVRQYRISATKATCGSQAHVSRSAVVRAHQQDSASKHATSNAPNSPLHDLPLAAPRHNKVVPLIAASLALSLLLNPAAAQAGPPRSLESKVREKQELYQQQLARLEAAFEQSQQAEKN